MGSAGRFARRPHEYLLEREARLHPGGPGPLLRSGSRRLPADGSCATSAQTGDIQRDAFDLHDHIFPVRGRHDYGGSGADFGSGRSGTRTRWATTSAKCGVPMVAARGGTVQYAGYHGAAGNYLVIDGSGSDLDYVYMHLAEPTAFREGDRIYTGQRIGSVGETGNAQGCHLHFGLLGRPGLVRRRASVRPAPGAAGLGQLVIAGLLCARSSGENAGVADWTIKNLEEIPDVLGDYSGRDADEPGESLGAEQLGFTWRRMPGATGGKGSYGHRQ